MSLDGFSRAFQGVFDEKMRAREACLAAGRRAIRSCANAIRAIHRGEMDEAHVLMDEARAAIDEGESAAQGHPEILFAGYIEDARKEYAEARLTEALVTRKELPGPDELRMGLPPFLNGMAEAIGEGRRAVLDLLRAGQVERCEAILGTMEDMYYLLVSMDYPDAITGHLRRSTDVARGIMERTRADLSVSAEQHALREALERHTRGLHGPE